MIGAVSICHYDFQNAHRSKFPIWNDAQSHSPLLSRSVTEQNDNGDSGGKSVLCTAFCEA